MNKTATIYLLGLVFAMYTAKAQDHHLSHYDVASMYLNPAATGMYKEEPHDGMLYLAHRSQWNALGTNPFLTSYLAFDIPCEIGGKSTGLGFFVINNNGGLGNFNKLTFMASGSYDIIGSRVKSDNKHLLSFGLQLGLFYTSTNVGSLSYDVQYSTANNGGFNPNIPSNENFSQFNVTRFDANYGIYYRYLDKGHKAHPYAGFSMLHLTRPNESLTGGASRLPIKFTGYGGCDISVNEKVDVNPRMLFSSQANAYEFTMGLLFDALISENGVKGLIGVDYRLDDAIILSLGLKQEFYAVRFSYDFNTSYLKKYTSGRGAYEISMVYVIKKGKPVLKKSVLQY